MSLVATYIEDPAANLVGIQVEECRPGYAKAILNIQPQHLNGLGTAHGGIIFLLTDTAFAYACNSLGIQTVASSCNITYHAPTQCGDTLTAVAEEKFLQGRNGIYDVLVTNQKGETIAHFRGNSFALKSQA